MEPRTSIIERAFQLASSGRCATVSDIRAQLTRENYSTIDAYIRGQALLRQLNYLILSARAASPAGAQDAISAAP